MHIYIYYLYIIYILYIYVYIYIYIYCYTHCSSSGMSTLVLQDLHLIWAALISVLVNTKGGGVLWKKLQSVILEGVGYKKMSFWTNIFFEWPLILEINNFLNFLSKSNVAWNVKSYKFLSHNSLFQNFEQNLETADITQTTL